MPPHVLIVEDHPDNATVLRVIFQHAGFAVVCAESIDAAWRALARMCRLDLVILDLVLPDGDGLDLGRALKALRPALPVVVLTAWVEVGIRCEACRTCADLFVTKPFDPDDLVAGARRLLARGRRPPREPASAGS